RLGRGALLAQLVFGHDRMTNHPAGFADVELMGPISIVEELVLRQAPLPHLLLNVLGHTGIVGDEVEPPLLVGFVLLDDFAAAFVAGLGIVVVVAEVVGAEGNVIVGVGLVV